MRLTAAVYARNIWCMAGLQASIDSLKKILSIGRVKESDPTVASYLWDGCLLAAIKEVTIGNEWICKDHIMFNTGRSDRCFASLQLIKRFYTSAR